MFIIINNNRLGTLKGLVFIQVDSFYHYFLERLKINNELEVSIINFAYSNLTFLTFSI